MNQLYKIRPKWFLRGIPALLLLCTVTWKTPGYAAWVSDFGSHLTILDTVPKRAVPSQKSVVGSQPASAKATADKAVGSREDSVVTGATQNPKPITQNLSSDTTVLPVRDSNRIIQKVDTFNLKISKDSLDAPVKYQASDSAVIQIVDKKILLYGKTKTNYKDIELTAPRVEMDQQTQIVTAVNKRDSTGAITENAHFKSADNEFTSDTIRYNFKSQVGLTKNTYTTMNEIIVQGQTIKRTSENTAYVSRARFTTCNLDDPHFAFITPKMKVINNKLAVSGPAHPEFEGVPVPIYIPFGLFPLTQGRHSGLLPPQFATNEVYGLGLEGLGYYKVLNDYWDAKVYGNVYSYGGWSINLNPTYRKRYHYSGSFNLSIQNTKINFKGDPDYSKNKSFFITWSHSVDSKARPGTSFSASVNAGSTSYNRNIPNSNQANFNNQLGSSISYSKSWKDKPFNLTLSANHSQNNRTRLVNLSLPDAGFTVNTLYPFQKKEAMGAPKWFEKLGVGYNGSFRNQVSFYDTAFRFKRLIDTMQWGAQHNFPINLQLPPLFGGALLVSPSISYQQNWIAQKFRRSWNDVKKKLDTTITKGFFMDQTASFGLSLNTAIFGKYQFKGSRIIAIRHVMRPSVSLNYKPDLSRSHFYYSKVDTTNYRFRFNEYEGSMYGFFGEGKYGGMSFSLDNNLEMKYRSKKDTGEAAIRKIRLIDGYGLSTGYNFFADSMKLAPVQFYFRANLFEKINISANTTLNPYQTDSRGMPIAKYAWQGGKFKPGRLSNGSISISTSFSSKPKDPKKEEEKKKAVQQRLNDPSLIGDQQRLLDYMRQNPSEFVDFNIPWQISFSYSLYFQERIKPDYSGFTKDVNSNLNFSGSFSLTPKWNFSTNGYYDFHTNKLQTFQMSINREMHCWQLSINVTPVGLYRSFSFTLNPKASVLQDLKINRTRYFTGY